MILNILLLAVLLLQCCSAHLEDETRRVMITSPRCTDKDRQAIDGAIVGFGRMIIVAQRRITDLSVHGQDPHGDVEDLLSATFGANASKEDILSVYNRFGNNYQRGQTVYLYCGDQHLKKPKISSMKSGREPSPPLDDDETLSPAPSPSASTPSCDTDQSAVFTYGGNGIVICKDALEAASNPDTISKWKAAVQFGTGPDRNIRTNQVSRLDIYKLQALHGVNLRQQSGDIFNSLDVKLLKAFMFSTVFAPLPGEVELQQIYFTHQLRNRVYKYKADGFRNCIVLASKSSEEAMKNVDNYVKTAVGLYMSGLDLPGPDGIDRLDLTTGYVNGVPQNARPINMPEGFLFNRRRRRDLVVAMTR
ncbi:MAG: hypothetical protein M1825_001778 [Sarcosagium campestre]|nr:MAG: hypothetical protein M1825_001778 [Sarcosagium campestre]